VYISTIKTVNRYITIFLMLASNGANLHINYDIILHIEYQYSNSQKRSNANTHGWGGNDKPLQFVRNNMQQVAEI